MVVVPAYRAATTIGRTLSSLLDQPVSQVVVVVSPGDRTAERVMCFERCTRAIRSYDLQVLVAPQRLSAGAARNLGRTKATDSAWLFFLDADTAVEPGSIQRLLACARQRNLDVVSAAIDCEGRKIVSRVRHALEFKEAEGRGRPAVGWRLPSTALLVRASVFDRVEGFPDAWPGEDLIFDWDVEHSGARRAFEPQARVRHLHPSGIVEMLRHQRRLGRTAAWARCQRALPGSKLTGPGMWLSAIRLLLGPARLVRGLGWYARYDRAALPLLTAGLPLWFAGACVWARGFHEGVELERHRISDAARAVPTRVLPQPSLGN